MQDPTRLESPQMASGFRAAGGGVETAVAELPSFPVGNDGEQLGWVWAYDPLRGKQFFALLDQDHFTVEVESSPLCPLKDYWTQSRACSVLS